MKWFIRVILRTYMAANSVYSHCGRNTPQFHYSPGASTKDHRQPGQKIVQVQINEEMPQKIRQRQRLCPDSWTRSPQLLPAADLTPLPSAPREPNLSWHIHSVAAGFRIVSAASSSQNTPKGEGVFRAEEVWGATEHLWEENSRAGCL